MIKIPIFVQTCFTDIDRGGGTLRCHVSVGHSISLEPLFIIKRTIIMIHVDFQPRPNLYFKIKVGTQ